MLNERIAELTDYPFERLRALLGDSQPGPGMAPIAMSIGEPRHAPPPIVAETVAGMADAWNKYPATNGTAELRQAITDWLTRRYALPQGMIEADRNVLPVAGTREALFMAGLACVPRTKAGRRPVVLTPNPLYQVYAGAAIMAGAELVPVPATRETGFLPDYEALPESLLDRCALAYLCSPSNPEGAVADRARLGRLVALARRHDFVLAADHCYADIYDRDPPASALDACVDTGGGLDGVLVFHSLSKRSSVPGLRSGFVAGAKDVIAAFGRLRSYAGATTPVPIAAAAAALWRDEAHVDANRALYRAKFDIAERIIGNRFGFYRPAGGFYLWLDVGDGEAAARTLWSKAGLRTLPGAYLARDQANGENPGARYIRVSLVDELPVVKTGLERLADVL